MSDVTEITTVVGALAVHVDAREWDAVLALFAPSVRVDYTSLFGGEAATTQREQLIAQWRGLLPGFTRTTHLIGAPLVSIATDTATVRASVVAWHFIDDAHWIACGCYEMELRRIDGAWRITSLTLARAWQQGDAELPKAAAARAATASV
jgi:hypothetical protein